jgi:predicted small secreted protein
MKMLILLIALSIVSLSILTGCHNTGRQIRKAIDSTHDVFLEGSD